MDLLGTNLADIERRFTTEGAREAIDILDGRVEVEDLDELLRPLDAGSVTAAREIRQRDGFDDLLWLYSIVEIACIAGYVPAPLPEPFAAKARARLGRREVRAYYEKRYPLLLPQRLRQRVAGEWKAVVEPEAQSRAVTLFNSFLEINATIDGDPNVDTFLWLLDDGSWGGYWLEDLLERAKDSEAFGRSIGFNKKVNRLDRAVRGFAEYVGFCVALDDLLMRAARMPILQSAMWHLHAYWFENMREKLRLSLVTIVGRIETWSDATEPGDLEGASRAVERLASGDYGRALTMRAVVTPVSST